MDRRVYKNYVNLSNVVFRLSNGSEASKEHAILVNGHLVSFLSINLSDRGRCLCSIRILLCLVREPPTMRFHVY